MKTRKRALIVRFSRKAVMVTLWFCLLGQLQCNLPAGCGPGAVTTSPYISELVDYSDPPSGMIMAKTAFTSLTIYFSDCVDATTVDFDRLEDFLRVYRIENFWEADEEHAWVETPLDGVFSGHEWSCEQNSRCCDPVNLPNSKNVLVLSVDGSNPGLLTDRHLRVELLGGCQQQHESPPRCSENPLTSWDGHPLAENLNIFIGLMEEGAQPPDPYFTGPFIVDTWPYLTDNTSGFVEPHGLFRFRFSRKMGFVNLSVDRLEGFNFVYSTEGDSDGLTVLKSDSIQGLAPGEPYQLDFLSSELAPAGEPPGIPFTMDHYGNALLSLQNFEWVEATSTYGFKTSHVRILFPMHEPFSNEPDDWAGQLDVYGFENHVILAEVNSDVDELSLNIGGVRFADVDVPDIDEGTQVIRIDIDDLDSFNECSPDRPMEIFTYQPLVLTAWERVGQTERRSLGSDRLYVNPFPPDYDFGFPEQYVYLGNYPENDEDDNDGFKNELNGVAHDNFNWYFSKNDPARLLKVPVNLDLRHDYYYDDPVLGVYASRGFPGFNHFGDIDVYNGLICVPLEGERPGMGFTYSSPEGGDFEYVSHSYFYLTDQISAGWCAFHQEGDSLMLYTSNSTVDDAHPIFRYEVDVIWSDPPVIVGLYRRAPYLQLQSAHQGWNQLPMYENEGWALKHMQGGVFSDRGHLYLVNGYSRDFDRYKGGIWVFAVDGSIATLVDHSSQDSGTFRFKFHPRDWCGGEEPEGIDIWDLDNNDFGNAPGISGQIHVIMIDNCCEEGKDDLYFKHYTASPVLCKI